MNKPAQPPEKKERVLNALLHLQRVGVRFIIDEVESTAAATFAGSSAY